MVDVSGRKKSLAAHIWARHPHDYYIEAEWCSQALFKVHRFIGSPILDPACGSGRILRAAEDVGLPVIGTDLVRRSRWCQLEADFMDDEYPKGFFTGPVDIVCNPPFKFCQVRTKPEPYGFIARALDLVRPCGQVAMLMPATWMHADKTARFLSETGLSHVYVLTPRPSMPPGTVIEAGKKPGGGKTDFSWYVWSGGHTGPVELHFLRRSLVDAVK